MKRMVANVVSTIDTFLATAVLSVRREDGLLPLVFHSLLASKDELASGSIHPRFVATLESLDRVVQLLSEAGYTFVRPDDLEAPLDPAGRYALLTFDDGYANQIRALPILEKHNVPATYFVSTGHIETGMSFSWDVLYRNLSRAGATPEQQRSALRELQQLIPSAIEQRLTDRFGAAALLPDGELDRPMRVAELQNLAASPLVTIGNHTRDHAILPNLDDDGAADQLRQAQTDVQKWIGVEPSAFAFPDGVVDKRLTAWARETGLSWGFTVDAVRQPLPTKQPNFEIGRFQLDPGHGIAGQLKQWRSPLSIMRGYRRLSRAARQ